MANGASHDVWLSLLNTWARELVSVSWNDVLTGIGLRKVPLDKPASQVDEEASNTSSSVDAQRADSNVNKKKIPPNAAKSSHNYEQVLTINHDSNSEERDVIHANRSRYIKLHDVNMDTINEDHANTDVDLIKIRHSGPSSSKSQISDNQSKTIQKRVLKPRTSKNPQSGRNKMPNKVGPSPEEKGSKPATKPSGKNPALQPTEPNKTTPPLVTRRNFEADDMGIVVMDSLCCMRKEQHEAFQVMKSSSSTHDRFHIHCKPLVMVPHTSPSPNGSSHGQDNEQKVGKPLDAMMVKKKNKVLSLLVSDGDLITDSSVLESMAFSFFSELYNDNIPDGDFILHGAFPNLNIEDFNSIGKEVTDLEIRTTLFNMDSFKAPGRDGLQAIFYKS
ncbi:hypothetical protein PIB30_044569 [Stylosanthes scabra]|uniref:Uncharacterized protein n=1 Tax=Stylosanthes scabra TaxID=79078 RepID=A0ABU6WFS1_9FABA|nr:hypothetical protein [Stylosanthes scabra]